MDSNSLDKALNSILNTLPRTLAPLEAIKLSSWQKNSKKKKIQKKFKKNFQKIREITMFTSRLSSFDIFFQCLEAIGNIA
jgi:hypothetical protein